MVVFVCGKCNESLKKKFVEQHFNNCHNNSISCVDCSRDFSRQSYSVHTVCISEKEKYDKANFVQKTPKGVGKQEEWTEAVHGRLKGFKHNPRINMMVAKLLESNNIPRKKSKIENFLKSSFPFAKQSDIDIIWDKMNIPCTPKSEDTVNLPFEANNIQESSLCEENGDNVSTEQLNNSKTSKKRKHESIDACVANDIDTPKIKKKLNSSESPENVQNEMSLREIVLHFLREKEKFRVKKLKKLTLAMFVLSSKFHKDEHTDEALERQFEKILRSKKRFNVSDDGKHVSIASSEQTKI